MNEKRAREIFAEELGKLCYFHLASAVRNGDKGDITLAAIAAMQRVANEVADATRVEFDETWKAGQ